jgi:AraC family transcriptional regulator of adaptative response / DNA-3-methyladenine glycosylase II
MITDDEARWRAVKSRDRRFEGAFVVAVLSTRIYCRPGCPARLPLRRNVRFYPSAAGAIAAGFRACLRCRPDRAPGPPVSSATPNTLRRALRLIDEGALRRSGESGGASEGVEALAERLGVGARRLRTLFGKHLGASPHAVATSRRLVLARALVESTPLSMTEIAATAGFASVRRFNDAFAKGFGGPPSSLRKPSASRSADPRSPAGIELALSLRPPFDWSSLVAFFSSRAIGEIEGMESDAVYFRRIRLADLAGVDHAMLRVRRLDERRLAVSIAAAPLTRSARSARSTLALPALELHTVIARVRRLFDLDADPAPIEQQLRADRLLEASVDRHPGLRVPGAWSVRELCLRAVIGQRISVAAARTLAERWLTRFGSLELRRPSIDAGDIAALGVPRVRAETLATIARLDEASFDRVEPLAGVRGVGPWTAAYVAMRAGRDPDAFPASDLGVLRALGVNDAAAATARAEAFRPWRAYAVMHLWRLSTTTPARRAR